MTLRPGFNGLIWLSVLAVGFSGCGDRYAGTIDGTRPPQIEAAPVKKTLISERSRKTKKKDDLSPKLNSGESRP